MSRLISQFFCNLNSSKKLHLPVRQVNNRSHCLIAKSTSPELSDTAFLQAVLIDINFFFHFHLRFLATLGTGTTGGLFGAQNKPQTGFNFGASTTGLGTSAFGASTGTAGSLFSAKPPAFGTGTAFGANAGTGVFGTTGTLGTGLGTGALGTGK